MISVEVIFFVIVLVLWVLCKQYTPIYTNEQHGLLVSCLWSCGCLVIVLCLLLYWLCSIMMAGWGWHHQDSSVRMAASRWTAVELFLCCHYVGFVSTLHLCFSYCWWLCNCGSIVVVVVLPCHMVYSLFVKLAWWRQSHSCCSFVMVNYWWLCPGLFGILVTLWC